MGDVIGCYYANEPPGKYFSDQRDDPTEELYRILLFQLRMKYPEVHWGHLESCGVNAFANCLGVTLHGRPMIDHLTKTLGVYKNQASHLFIGYLNDPSNYAKMKELRSNLDPKLIQGNRVPQYYELLAREYCGIIGHFEWGCSMEKIEGYLVSCHPVQVCEPGHYLAAVGYDKDEDKLKVLNSNPKTGNGEEYRTREQVNGFEKWLIWYEIQ